MLINNNELIKNAEQIKIMEEAGKIVAQIHNLIKENAKPGVTLKHLDGLTHKFIIEKEATPSFLGYEGFPNVVCLSLNSAMIHGVPSDKVLKEGDVLSVDVAVKYKGYSADAATTFGIGEISEKDKKIIDATKDILKKAIEVAKDGNTLGDIGEIISSETKKYGYSVSKNYAGHFIGKEMHEEPLVLNYGKKGKGMVLKEGMTLCIEPMLFYGKEELIVDPFDNWTVYVKNGKTATHEEHTIVVGKTEGRILTKI